MILHVITRLPLHFAIKRGLNLSTYDKWDDHLTLKQTYLHYR